MCAMRNEMKEVRARKLQERKVSLRSYQSRTREKRKFLMAAVAFIQRLYFAHPKNMNLEQIKTIHFQVAHIMRLRRGWSEQDLCRAWNELKKLENQVYNGKYAKFSVNYQRLYSAVMEPLQNMAATADERADVVAAAMSYVGKELSAEYGDKKPATKQAFLLALAGMEKPQPKWFVDAIVDYLLTNLV